MVREDDSTTLIPYVKTFSSQRGAKQHEKVIIKKNYCNIRIRPYLETV